MGFKDLDAGEQVPDRFNVVIEIPSNCTPVKYEIDKASGLVRVDRFLRTAMFYPCEYGFIPKTLSEDGDPVDVLLVSPYPLLPRCILSARPVGMLRMTDESGKDTKILAVPIDKLTPRYQHVHKPEDVGSELLLAIEHFFTHYKDLEPGKWTKIAGWEGIEAAKSEITDSVKRYQPFFKK